MEVRSIMNKSILFWLMPIMLMGNGCAQKNDQKDTAQSAATPTNIQQGSKMESRLQRHTTTTGLSYEIAQEGNGRSPRRGERVVVHYTGWLDEQGKPGKKFDSSVDRKAPFDFTIGVGQVIRGWDEGVLSMKVGEKRRLFIPANLGYGDAGAGRVIPPNAKLIFDVELLSIG